MIPTMSNAWVLVAVMIGCGDDHHFAQDASTSDVGLDVPADAPADARLPHTIHYLKASNAEGSDRFGTNVVVSADGNTIAVSATGEKSGARGIGGNQDSNTSGEAGAVYVFARGGDSWVQQAYVKASNTNANYELGSALALSADGNTLAVGSYGEQSASKGINQDQSDANLLEAGAVYVFQRVAGVWTQQAYVKASNTDRLELFGVSVAVSGDGNTLAVGASWESSASTGIDGDQSNQNAALSGAVYVFTRAGVVWSQQAYLKASNTESGDYFGSALALSGDGDTLAVGAMGESSAASGIDGNQLDNTAPGAGAVYVFRRATGAWTQEAYVKAAAPGRDDAFGLSVALSNDGSTLVAGAQFEDSATRGIGGDPENDNAMDSGAAYVFSRTGSAWSQQAYVKASNADPADFFGCSVALDPSGNQLLVGARGEAGASIGFGGDPDSNDLAGSGAAYLFGRAGSAWTQTAYLKASNTDASDGFGDSVSIDQVGRLVISAIGEASSATGVDGDQTLNDAPLSGATYVLE